MNAQPVIAALGKLIADIDGAPSSYRVAFLFVVFAIVGTWCFLSIKAGAFIALPPGAWTLIVSAFGGKVAQSFSENFSAPKTDTVSDLATKNQ